MRMLKKLLASFTALSIAVGMSVVPAHGANTFTVALQNAAVKAGETVTVNLELKDNPGLNSLSVYVYYDTEVLECTAATAIQGGWMMADAYPNNEMVESAWIRDGYKIASFSALSMTTNRNNGQLATLTFRALSDLESCTTDLDMAIVSATDSSSLPITGNTEKGELTITGIIPRLDTVTLEKTAVAVQGGDSLPQRFQATAVSERGTQITSGAAWSVAPASQGVTVDVNGVVSVAAKAVAGTYTVRAGAKGNTAQGNASSTFVVSRSSPALQTISLSDTSVTVNGRDTGYRITTSAVDQYGDPYTVSNWSVSNQDTTNVYVDGSAIVIGPKAKAGTYTVTGDGKNATFTINRTAPMPMVITISGGTATLDVPADGAANNVSAPFTAAITDQYGDPFSGTVNWSIEPSVSGVSISNGMVTVSNTAKSTIMNTTGQEFTVRAVCKDGISESSLWATQETTVQIKRSTPILSNVKLFRGTSEVGSQDTLIIPASGSQNNVYSYAARSYDQYGAEMTGSYTWGFATADDKVTATNGTVTVMPGATKDKQYTLTATEASGEKATTTITVKDIEIVWPTVTIKSAPTYGDTWNRIVTIRGGSASINGVNVPGSFTVKNGTEIPVAGQHSYTLNFKSTDNQYNIDHVGTEQITVAKKPVNVSADNKTKIYGQANPTLTFTVPSGVLVGQDTKETLGVTLSCSATDATSVGTVSITGTGSADNYIVTVTSAVLTITKAEITGIVTANPATVTILANDGNNTQSNLKNVFSGGNALPSWATVSFGNGKTENLPVTWTTPTSFDVKGGEYTLTGLLSVGNNFNGTEKKLTAKVTVTPVRITEIIGIPSAKTFSKAQVAAAEGLSTLGIPTQVTLKYDNGVSDQTINAVFNKDIAAVKAVANSVTATTDKTVDVELTEANFPAWATRKIALPKTTISITNKYVIPEADISFAPITTTYGTDYAPSATVANKPEYAGIVYSYAYAKDGKAVEKPTDAGAYTVTVTAENSDYKGTKTVALNIAPKTITGVSATLPENFAAVYNKAEHKPTITVKDGETALVLDRDYTVVYSNNISAGTAAVTITGKGNYDSATSVVLNFEISKADLSGMKPTVFGIAEAGQTLTAVLDEVDADEITWNWTVGGSTATSANGDKYTIKETDSNQPITVTATAVEDKNYTGTTQASDVKTVAKVTVFGWINIAVDKGTENVDPDKTNVIEAGDALRAEVKIVPEGIPLTYQWYNNGTAIDGAISSTYKVGRDAKILKVTADPGVNYDGLLTSSEVELGKRILTGTISLIGTPALTVGEKAKIRVDTVATADDYTIAWFRNGQAIPGLTDEYTITKDDLGTTLFVKVTANGTRYTGELSPLTLEIPATQPDMPVVHAEAGDGQVVVSWTAPFDNGSPITGYTLQVDDAAPISFRSDVTTYTVSGLTNGTEYTFKVTAMNGIGASNAGEAKATPKAPVVTPPYSGGGGGSSSSSLSISISSKIENGKVTVNKKNPQKGDSVTITVKPDSGYQIENVTVTDRKGNVVAITDLGDGKYSFTMPSTRVSIDAKFAKKAEQPTPSTPPAVTEKTPVTEVFHDVHNTDWFANSVQYAYDNGLMIGVDENSFAPNITTSRCMLVTILYRLEKEPATSTAPFTDVTSGKYYSNAVSWATENGIVNGYGDGTLRPDSPLTREQLATILYRYATTKSYDVNRTTSLSSFTDEGQISNYAHKPLEWANAIGIINGTDWGGLYPGGYATRAEVAAVLERFIRLVTE